MLSIWLSRQRNIPYARPLYYSPATGAVDHQEALCTNDVSKYYSVRSHCYQSGCQDKGTMCLMVLCHSTVTTDAVGHWKALCANDGSKYYSVMTHCYQSGCQVKEQYYVCPQSFGWLPAHSSLLIQHSAAPPRLLHNPFLCIQLSACTLILLLLSQCVSHQVISELEYSLTNCCWNIAH